MDPKQSLLMMSAIASAETLATAIAEQLDCDLEVVGTVKSCIAALRRGEYALLIIDEALIAGDPDAAELIWKHAGSAVPLQVNFAISGMARLVRETRAALARREQEQALAMRAATIQKQGELKSTVAGLLLQSELAFAEPAVSPRLSAKLKLIVEIAGALRQQLEQPSIKLPQPVDERVRDANASGEPATSADEKTVEKTVETLQPVTNRSDTNRSDRPDRSDAEATARAIMQDTPSFLR